MSERERHAQNLMVSSSMGQGGGVLLKGSAHKGSQIYTFSDQAAQRLVKLYLRLRKLYVIIARRLLLKEVPTYIGKLIPPPPCLAVPLVRSSPSPPNQGLKSGVTTFSTWQISDSVTLHFALTFMSSS